MEQQEMLQEWFEEEALAKLIGIAISRVHAVRKNGADMERGKEWRYDHGRVAYTRIGAEKLLALLGVELLKKRPRGGDLYGRKTLDEVLASAQLGDPQPGMEDCHRFMVMKRMMNPRILMCGIPSHPDLPYGYTCRVRVKDNADFVMGMELMARPVPNEPLLYHMVGPMPRRRGRW